MLEGRGTADSHRTAYRSDLDGLRAVAVLSVIAYHLSPKLLPGGYLGVDIFFVLSGYLITNIVWREALSNEFTIAAFYERRVRRIMPALLFLLLVISACSIWILLPIDLIGYAKSVLASLAFAANLYFWRDTDYFAQSAADKPLLHVWSLGVEEQFYIFFPLFVILCIRWRRSALVPLTMALVLISLAADMLSNRFGVSGAAFYVLPTRAWELGAGALLALAPTATISRIWARQILAALAAALLIAGLFSTYSWLAGAIPVAVWTVAGSTLTILLGSAGGSWLNWLLSRSPAVWVGLISYSLYLWHWPVFVLAHYYLVQDEFSIIQALIAMALIFLLAALSWRYIERPFRNRSMPIRRVLVWVGSGCLLVALAAAAALASKGFPSRFSPEIARINSAVGSHNRCSLSEYFYFGAMHACPLVLPNHDPADATVVLYGNSHAQMYAPLVTDFLLANHETGFVVAMNSCRPTPDLNLSMECMSQAARNLEAIENLPKARIVIVATTWDPLRLTPTGEVPVGSETAYMIQSLDRMIASLQQHGKTVVLVGPISTPDFDVSSIVARQMAFHHNVTAPVFLPEGAFEAKEGAILAHFSARKDIVFIRPDLIQCRSGQCDYFRDGEALFADDSHLAKAALPLFQPAFEPGLEQAFALAGLSRH
jgi:peptidoglycan/LPS O-acetylase OafA/YrhL